MQKLISSGIRTLDELIGSFRAGDNVLWEVEAGTFHENFIGQFLARAARDNKDIIYISFNRPPQAVLDRYPRVFGENSVLLDCFTSGKGKDDSTFGRYYDKVSSPNVIRMNRPSDIEHFTKHLNEIEDRLPKGACYVFDSLTGMQDLWGGEDRTFKFFTYMCPRLFELDTVAYWLMEKDAHSDSFKANLRHITQVVFDLSRRNEALYIRTLKLDGQRGREAFRTRQYEIYGDGVQILPSTADMATDMDLGSKTRMFRIRAGLSQKELADRVGLTPSSISQIENNQISPSMHNFMLICRALNIAPAEFWTESKEPRWVIRGSPLKENEKRDILSSGRASAILQSISHGATLREGGRGLFVYVLKGALTVESEGERATLFEADALSFEKERKCKITNTGGAPALVLKLRF